MGESFSFKQFTIRQERCAMKVGTDGVLLGAWAECSKQENARILDIGTGTGLCAIMMAQRFPQASITAIDIDAEAVEQARENIAASPFAECIDVVHCAVQDYKISSETQSGDSCESRNDAPSKAHPSPTLFDAIISNPPFFENSLTSPDSQRTVSRHTTTLTFLELMRAAYHLLADDGLLSVVIPFDALSRMDEAAALTGFFLTKQCAVRTTAKKAPKRVLLSYAKVPTATLAKDELIIGSDEYKSLTGEFYL